MSQIELYTYQDAVEHLLDAFDLPRDSRNTRLARRAVSDAYRELPNMHRWTQYQREHHVKTEASYSTGTIAYDHTGGSFERQLTLTSGTWPTNADFGWVIISEVRYAIEDRKSGTVVTLTANSNPGADVAAATSYTWYRSTYPLPVGVRRISPVVELDTAWTLEYVTPEDFIQRQVGNYSPTRPWFYTFHAAGEYYGSVSIELAPPPSEARTYSFMCEVRPEALRVEKQSTGTVTVGATGTTVTGTGTAFASEHVGSIIRFSSSSTEPTSWYGGLAGDNPYAVYRVITDVTNATTLTIDQSPGQALTGVAFVISDPIDIESGAMWELFERMAEERFAIITNQDRRDIESRRAITHAALIKAASADHINKDLHTGVSRASQWRYGDLDDWAIIDYS